MKKCKSCFSVKDYYCFYKHTGMKDGYLNHCKECVKKTVRSRTKDNPNKYNYTEKGVIRVIFKTQKRNSILRNSYITYTKDELKYWAYESGFKKLYDLWVKGGHLKDQKPSVDRIDTLKGYSFDNIRLVTWKDNREAQYDDIKKAIGTSGKRCKSVMQYDLHGNFLGRYASQKIAQKETGVSSSNISSCCTGKTKTAGGYVWRIEII